MHHTVSKKLAIFSCITLLGCSSMTTVSAATNVWKTSTINTPKAFSQAITQTENKTLKSLVTKDQKAGKVLSVAKTKKIDKQIKKLTIYGMNFDDSLYQTKSQKTNWNKKIKSILPSSTTKQRKQYWKTLTSIHQVKTSTPVTKRAYHISYKKNSKKAIVYFAVRYVTPQKSDDVHTAYVKAVLKKSGTGYSILSVTNVTPATENSSDTNTGGSGNSGNTGGSSGTGGSGIGGSAGKPDSSNDSTGSNTTVEGKDNVVDISDLGWDKLFE
ncbi:MAG: hypothetical protein ACI4CT_08700 [Lachnospiraceae bacterium]